MNQAKIAHYSSLVEESSSNQKKIFNIVEMLLHQPKTTVLPSTHSDQDLANAFSNFFVTKIETQTQPHIDKHCRLFMFERTYVTEFKELIIKSCALDSVPTSLIKQNIDVFAKYITIIVNRSLSSGCFPDSQKVAQVKPLLKKPNLDSFQELPCLRWWYTALHYFQSQWHGLNQWSVWWSQICHIPLCGRGPSVHRAWSKVSTNLANVHFTTRARN